MRSFWNTVEKLDDLAFRTLDKIDAMRNRGTYRERTEKAVEHVREPQRAIQFDN